MNGDSKGDPFSSRLALSVTSRANLNADSDQRSAPGKPVGSDVEPIQPLNAQQSGSAFSTASSYIEFLCDEIIPNGRTVANETQSASGLYDSVIPFMVQSIPNDAGS